MDAGQLPRSPFLAGLQVPELDGAADRGRGHGRLVGGDGKDTTGNDEVGEAAKLLTRGGVPDVSLVRTGRHDALAAIAWADGQDAVAVAEARRAHAAQDAGRQRVAGEVRGT